MTSKSVGRQQARKGCAHHSLTHEDEPTKPWTIATNDNSNSNNGGSLKSLNGYSCFLGYRIAEQLNLIIQLNVVRGKRRMLLEGHVTSKNGEPATIPYLLDTHWLVYVDQLCQYASNSTALPLCSKVKSCGVCVCVCVHLQWVVEPVCLSAVFFAR